MDKKPSGFFEAYAYSPRGLTISTMLHLAVITRGVMIDNVALALLGSVGLGLVMFRFATAVRRQINSR